MNDNIHYNNINNPLTPGKYNVRTPQKSDHNLFTKKNSIENLSYSQSNINQSQFNKSPYNNDTD